MSPGKKKASHLGAIDREVRQQEDRVAASSRSRRYDALAFALFVFASFLAFGNSLDNEFVRDDLSLIVSNPHIRSWQQLPTLLVSDYWASVERISDQLYRPLVMVSYLVNFAIGGTNPFGYHVVNLILHIFVVLGVYQLALRLQLRWEAAVLGALLFAVHPIHTEVVDPVTGRADLFSTLGVLFALNWYVDLEQRVVHRRRWMLASWGAFAAALLAKESALVLPVLLVLYEAYAWGRKTDWRRLATDRGSLLFGYLLVLIAYMLVRWAVMGTLLRPGDNIAFLDNPVARADWYLRSLTAWVVAGKYLWLFVWPVHLSVDYSYDAIARATSLWDIRVLLSLIVWSALCGFAFRSYLHGPRNVFFAVGFFVISFVPVSNWLVPIGTIMGERLLYMPSVGLCLLVGCAWQWLFERFNLQWSGMTARGLAAAAVAVLVLLTVRTVARNREWGSNLLMWEVATQVVPNSAKAHYVVGVFALTEHRFPEALESLDRALEIYPGYPDEDVEFAKRYGTVLLKLGRAEDAIPYLERAVTAWPSWDDAQMNLGLSYAMQGLWKKSEAAFRKTITLDINKLKAHKGLMVALRKQGRYLEAIEAADQALSVDEYFVTARYNKAAALRALGRDQEAREELVAIEKAQGPQVLETGVQEGAP